MIVMAFLSIGLPVTTKMPYFVYLRFLEVKLVVMPMYEYQCKNCGEHFEIEQRMIDDPIQIHEKCGGNVVKVFSSAGIVLKGSGFYKTDTRNSAKSSKATPQTDSSKPSTETTKPSSDTKKTGSKSVKTSDSKTTKKPDSSNS